jgi:hypothetical protein
MSYKITITINAEDEQDVKSHMSEARGQVVAAIKQNPQEPESLIFYDGIKSNHEIKIEVL